MSDFPFPSPGQHVRIPMPRPDPQWVARLQRRQEAIQLLSKGLRAFLSSITPYGTDDICVAVEFLLGNEIDEQLQRLETANTVPVPPPTLEDMERAQQDVEQCQSLLDALDKMIDGLPDASRDFLEKAQRPMLEGNLKRAEVWLSEIQRAMEASA
jgi:hypothetical protein